MKAFPITAAVIVIYTGIVVLVYGDDEKTRPSNPLDGIPFWKGEFGRDVSQMAAPVACDKKYASSSSSDDDDEVCLEWNGKVRLRIISRENDEKKMAADVNCTDVVWEALDCTVDMFEDCFDLTTANWYGGTVVRVMYWPIEALSVISKPYVTGDAIGVPPGYGTPQERYWLNSEGLAIWVDWEVPLWVGINATRNQMLCLKAQYTNSPYYNYDDSPVALGYTVCQGPDVRRTHEYMAATYFDKPTDIPDEKLFRYPIWSTWAQYKEDITQDQVIEFAEAIRSNGFDNSQMEIDDRWETHYGDMDFDPVKFPDPKGMVDTLSGMGFRTTLWVHPFVNIDSTAVADGVSNLAFVSDPGGVIPALTSWWQGSTSMTVDFTKDRGYNWFVERLAYLQATYNISSFKFDAGETNWLPNYHLLWPRNQRNPSRYTTQYARMAFDVDPDVRHQEVRVGAQTQDLPIFVRMLDKDSRWSNNNGLATIIPHALTIGLIGYPFILPDMVGGNAYGELPDRELFIRWIELNVFLPSVQFSIVPWQFDDEVVQISRNMSKLHETYADKLIDLARQSTITGAPIIRPVWWIAPNDPVALAIDSEFLVGNSLLVAPVVEENARSRDIYLPAGMWIDELRGGFIFVDGEGQWLRSYRVDLNELPYFTNFESP